MLAKLSRCLFPLMGPRWCGVWVHVSFGRHCLRSKSHLHVVAYHRSTTHIITHSAFNYTHKHTSTLIVNVHNYWTRMRSGCRSAIKCTPAPATCMYDSHCSVIQVELRVLHSQSRYFAVFVRMFTPQCSEASARWQTAELIVCTLN